MTQVCWKRTQGKKWNGVKHKNISQSNLTSSSLFMPIPMSGILHKVRYNFFTLTKWKQISRVAMESSEAAVMEIPQNNNICNIQNAVNRDIYPASSLCIYRMIKRFHFSCASRLLTVFTQLIYIYIYILSSRGPHDQMSYTIRLGLTSSKKMCVAKTLHMSFSPATEPSWMQQRSCEFFEQYWRNYRSVNRFHK